MSFADLSDGSIVHGIDVDENGSLHPNTLVWTGIGVRPTQAANCFDWGVARVPPASASGDYGRTARADAEWTQGPAPAPCTEGLHLYCFEQR